MGWYLLFPLCFLNSTGNTLYDLETNTASAFAAEASGWSLSSSVSAQKATKCDGYYILGGWNILGGSGFAGYEGQYFTRTYSSLPSPHNQMNMRLRMYVIDAWSGYSYEYFAIEVDGFSQVGWSTSRIGNYFLCGNPGWLDYPAYIIYNSRPHSANTLTLKFVSYGDQNSNTRSFGFRDIKIEFTTVATPASGLCGLGPRTLPSKNCPCADKDMYMNSAATGVCYSCPNGCQTCYDGSSCIDCKSGYFMYWNGTCLDSCKSPLTTTVFAGGSVCEFPCATNQFLYQDGTCSSTCPPPFVSDIQGTTNPRKFCQYFCANGYLYENGTCGDSCLLPYSIEIEATVPHRQLCKYPCSSSQYGYWNGSCLAGCVLPLVAETQGTKKFCWYPCGVNQYLYENGTCGGNCLLPYYIEVKGTVQPRQFCGYPCGASQYGYWNGSCLAGCVLPLVAETQGTNKFCWYPCATNKYLYWNGTCGDSCLLPFYQETRGTIQPRNLCQNPCGTNQHLYWNGTCMNDCVLPLIGVSEGSVDPKNFCKYPCNTNQFLYWNGTCGDSCSLPFYQETRGTVQPRNFCGYPCGLDQYLYWNGTCQDNCVSPLVAYSEGTFEVRNFCRYPCNTDQYLYWNGTCTDDCLLPFYQETRGIVEPRDFCGYPCGLDQYLYWNGTCQDDCLSPLVAGSVGTVEIRKFCWYPCNTNQYLYWNGTCTDDCLLPFYTETRGAIESRDFCGYPCGLDQYLYWNGTCKDDCEFPLLAESVGTFEVRQFCWYPCDTDKYLYWNGSCFDNCSFPLSHETLGTIEPREFCQYPCQPDQHLYWNGSCIDDCSLPLSPAILGMIDERNFCFYPCQPDEYLYWNGTCMTDCPILLYADAQGFPDVRNFCWNPCEINEYLYWNGSCLPVCGSPLSVFSDPGVQYCINPCAEMSPGMFLSENKTCMSSCSSPFLQRIEPGVQFCDKPCHFPNIFLYRNASCLPKCEEPYIQTSFSDVLICSVPCRKNSEFYYPFEKVCRLSCSHPYKQRMFDIIRICHIDVNVTLDEVTEMLKTADSLQTQRNTVTGEIKAAVVLRAKNLASAFLVGISSMMQYIRYMKINYPPKVQVLFLVSASDPVTFSFGIDMPKSLEEKLVDSPLPDVFEKYDINSNFVNSLWDSLILLPLIFAWILLAGILRAISKNGSKAHKILTKILEALKWNYPLTVICGASGDIFFYAALHLRSPMQNSLSIVLCFFICLLMVLLVIIVLYFGIKIILNFRKHKRMIYPEHKTDWKEKWKGYEILYEEYEEKSSFTIAYMTLFILRGMIFNLTLTIFFDYPLAQCIVINLANFFMLGYLLYLRPLKDKLDTAQLFVTEGFMNLLMICVLILGVMDKAKIVGKNTRTDLGSVILFAIQGFNIAALAFLGITLLLFLFSFYKKVKYLRAQKIKSPQKMLEILILGPPEEETRKVSPGSDLTASIENQKPLAKMATEFSHEKINPLQHTNFPDDTMITKGDEHNFTGILTSSDSPNIFLRDSQPSVILPTNRKEELDTIDLDTSEVNSNSRRLASRNRQRNRRKNEENWDRILRDTESPDVEKEGKSKGISLESDIETRRQANREMIQNFRQLRNRLKRFDPARNKDFNMNS